MLLVVAGHRGQLQPVQVFTQHGRADQAAGVPDRERHQLRRGLAGREHDVALVLPVRVVHHHDRAAGRNVGDGALHTVQGDGARCGGHDRAAAAWPPSMRSTYFPITSASRLTRLPGAARPRVVPARVAGIRLTSNQGCPALPSPVSRAEMVRLTPSTWPWTMCPPRRSPTRSDRSRLTGEPGARAPSPVRLSVSAMTSAVKAAPDRPVTVRQVPLTAIESPGRASAVTRGPRTVIRAASSRRSTDTTSPSSSTIPVNIRGCASSGPSFRRLRGTRRTRHRGPALARSATPRRVLPPIRAFTVGPGIPPGQPARRLAWSGSRTVTAGSEFHRPRSTLSLR